MLPGRRIWIVGPPGAGKSTYASRMARTRRVRHYMLDDLFWQPGWKRTPVPEFQRAVREIAAGEEWIVDGQYDEARPILLDRAETIVWLDVPRTVAARRLIGRTARRLLGRGTFCNGNRQGPLDAVQFLRWSFHVHAEMQATNARLLAEAGDVVQVVHVVEPTWRGRGHGGR